MTRTAGEQDESMVVGFADLLASLDAVVADLSDKSDAPHDYQIPSQAAARRTELAIAEWIGAGQSGLPPGLTKADYRAAIYDMARSSAQLRAYQQVAAIALFEHAAAASSLIATGKIMLGFGCLRGFIERTAILAENVRRLTPLASSDTEFGAILAAGEVIARTLYSTRLNWHALSGNDLRAIKPADLDYQKQEDSADMGAKNILNGIDRLEKLVPGTRATYSVLCEFLHPNVGDLISSTQTSRAFADSSGTRFISRQIGRGPSYLAGQFEIGTVISTANDISSDIAAKVPELLKELQVISDNVARATKKSQHKALRINRNIFSRSDLCPCLSGKTIAGCAPLAVKK